MQDKLTLHMRLRKCDLKRASAFPEQVRPQSSLPAHPPRHPVCVCPLLLAPNGAAREVDAPVELAWFRNTQL